MEASSCSANWRRSPEKSGQLLSGVGIQGASEGWEESIDEKNAGLFGEVSFKAEAWKVGSS